MQRYSERQTDRQTEICRQSFTEKDGGGGTNQASSRSDLLLMENISFHLENVDDSATLRRSIILRQRTSSLVGETNQATIQSDAS